VEKSEGLINIIRQYQYRAYWHMPMMFNPMNFFEVAENIYPNLYSINMLCVPNESAMDMRNFTEAADTKFHPLKR
jgi:hypothetical protein